MALLDAVGCHPIQALVTLMVVHKGVIESEEVCIHLVQISPGEYVVELLVVQPAVIVKVEMIDEHF